MSVMSITRRHALGLFGTGLLVAATLRLSAARPRDRAQVIDMVTQACQALDAYGFPRAIRHSDETVWMRPNDGLYVFILDLQGALQLHPDRKMEGRSVIDITDPTGKFFIREIIGAASAEPNAGVWTSYVWRAPATGTLGTKHTFSRMAGELIVSAGYFAEAA